MKKSRFIMPMIAMACVHGGVAVAQVERAGLHCQVPDEYHMIRTVHECPDGSSTSYEAWGARSSSYRGLHLDWEPDSYMDFPYPVAVCENGFVVDRQEDEQSPEWVAHRTALIADPAYRELIGRHTSHFLYARLLELEGAADAKVSWHYLNASWEADQCGMEAYDLYVREYLRVSEGEIAAMEPEADAYFVYRLVNANMYRRIGEFDEARERLERLIADHPEGVDPDWELAIALLDEAIRSRSTAQVAIRDPDEN